MLVRDRDATLVIFETVSTVCTVASGITKSFFFSVSSVKGILFVGLIVLACAGALCSVVVPEGGKGMLFVLVCAGALCSVVVPEGGNEDVIGVLFVWLFVFVWSLCFVVGTEGRRESV